MKSKEKLCVKIKSSLSVRGIGLAVQRFLYANGYRKESEDAINITMNSRCKEDCIKKLSKIIIIVEGEYKNGT